MNCKILQNKISEIIVLNEVAKILSKDEISHLNHCENCQIKLKEYQKVDDILVSMQEVMPPASVTKNYLSGIYQKLETQKQQSILTLAPQPKDNFIKSILHSFVGRLAMAGLTLAVVYFGIWQYNSQNDETDDFLTSDSIEYYLESFNNVSAANPVYVVKSVEYDWSYVESNDSNE